MEMTPVRVFLSEISPLYEIQVDLKECQMEGVQHNHGNSDQEVHIDELLPDLLSLEPFVFIVFSLDLHLLFVSILF